MNSINNSDIVIHQDKTIITLFDSNIPLETIAFQLDLSIKEVSDKIEEYQSIDKGKEKSILEASKVPKLAMLLLDTVFDIESAIKDAQRRTWYNLKVRSEFDVSQEKTQDLMESFIGTNVTLVILHVDLVSSTDLSMNLPLKRLIPIIQAFTQEMSLVIEAYGGYVFKYVGDAILAFFFTEKGDLYLPCVNAVNCANSMVTIIQKGMNVILESNSYPELGIRIGIDIEENAIVQYGLRPETGNFKNQHEPDAKKTNDISNLGTINDERNSDNSLKKPCLDILGYTINIASKKTSFAKPNQIIIGEVYQNLAIQTKGKFKNLDIGNIEWNYINNSTGNNYGLFVSS
ncbi:MAG TPA: adenylate/guanylate cyclase domain-containing protein [Candidatus Nitrosocosmicus sp.]|nr:adenylate/guanylate cyclase domain-containing protein [Candidatus Nitrosocosmicus sp.]